MQKNHVYLYYTFFNTEPSPQIFKPLNGLVKIKGEGKIDNGKTALSLNIKIIGNGGAGGIGKGPPTPTIGKS